MGPTIRARQSMATTYSAFSYDKRKGYGLIGTIDETQYPTWVVAWIP